MFFHTLFFLFPKEFSLFPASSGSSFLSSSKDTGGGILSGGGLSLTSAVVDGSGSIGTISISSGFGE